jgi:hypothetical protein
VRRGHEKQESERFPKKGSKPQHLPMTNVWMSMLLAAPAPCAPEKLLSDICEEGCIKSHQPSAIISQSASALPRFAE